MGMAEVAALAATAEFEPPELTSTATGRRTRSAASPLNRSSLPSAKRYSTETFLPSEKPASSNPFPNARTNGAESSADRVLRNPITGLADCCARAASGHAAAAPTILMNSRRCMHPLRKGFVLPPRLALRDALARRNCQATANHRSVARMSKATSGIVVHAPHVAALMRATGHALRRANTFG